MNKAYLGLGTNMGDREEYLRRACAIINDHKDIRVCKISKVYETKAWGYTNQNDFLNICMEIDTSLNPEELLDVCHDVENELNRVRTIRWGPRTIDVDILFFNDVVSDDKVLTLPHPRIKDRAFVLVPLMDLNENLVIDNKNISYYLSNLKKEDLEEVKKTDITFSL